MSASSPSATPTENLAPTKASFRFASPSDDQWVEDLQALAFGPGRFARTAFRVREQFPIDPSLSLIAEIDGVPVSSVWMTPISIGGVKGYMLGPLATDPAYRNKGAGKLLVREVTKKAMARADVAFVMLIGDPPYYGPMGFLPTTHGAIEFPGPVDPARVLVHSDDPDLALALKGPIAAFDAKE